MLMALANVLTSNLRVRSNENLAYHSQQCSLGELHEWKRLDYYIDERLEGPKFNQQLAHYH